MSGKKKSSAMTEKDSRINSPWRSIAIKQSDPGPSQGFPSELETGFARVVTSSFTFSPLTFRCPMKSVAMFIKEQASVFSDDNITLIRITCFGSPQVRDNPAQTSNCHKLQNHNRKENLEKHVSKGVP